MAGRALTDAEWRHWTARAPGPWFLAVVTTGVVCRCGCPARPLRQNMRPYDRLEDALADGFRACKRCRPGVTATSAGSLR
jgi:AraC family transcriptional regulator, regulatory protein of adaptative response / methylated-DNA-[protein]-cysteine methyltransferase